MNITEFCFAGGPAIFVISWAIIKAFAVESENIDGVSNFISKLVNSIGL